MSKKVFRVELHDGFFIPGLLPDQGGGAFGKSLPPANKTLKNLEMLLLDTGAVEVEWDDGLRRRAIMLGAANIKYCEYAPEPSKEKAAKAAK